MPISTWLSHGMTALALVIAIWAGRLFRAPGRIVVWVGVYFFASFLASLTGSILIWMKMTAWVNAPGHLHNCIAIAMLTLLYIEVLPPGWKVVLKKLGPTLVILALLNLLVGQGREVNSYSYIAAGLLGLICGIGFCYQLMVDLPALAIHRLPIFWFNTSFLIYNSSTLLQFIFRDYLADISWEILTMFVIFHNAVSLISMSLILVGLYYASAERSWVASNSEPSHSSPFL